MEQIEYWAEAGDWGSGPALLIMRGVVDREYDGQFYEDITVLVDEPITDPEDRHEVAEAVDRHGYRVKDWDQFRYSDYGIIIELKEWQR